MAYLLILSAAVTLYFALGYVRATLKGWVIPNKITWFLWALAPMIAFLLRFLLRGLASGKFLFSWLVLRLYLFLSPPL
ncbi:hypothetical protein NG812_03555 [Lactococcus garvieae]